jgi:hypothetical protein
LPTFLLPFGDCVTIDASDPVHLDDAAGAPLPSEKAGQKPAQSFVSSSQESVDRSMFAGNQRAGMLLANGAATNVTVLSMYHQKASGFDSRRAHSSLARNQFLGRLSGFWADRPGGEVVGQSPHRRQDGVIVTCGFRGRLRGPSITGARSGLG